MKVKRLAAVFVFCLCGAFVWGYGQNAEGDAQAACDLGDSYLYGKGVAQDYKLALEHYLKAAEQGHVRAQYLAATSYYCGLGAAVDYKEAAKWYRAAAEQGHAMSQGKLGHFFASGKGVEKNIVESIKWHKLASEQGELDSQLVLGRAYEYGYGVQQSFEEAAHWYGKAAKQGDVDAQSNLGWCYYYGEGVLQDYKTALKWFRLAAEQNEFNAQLHIGLCYKFGLGGVMEDSREAAQWFLLAAEQGHPEAQLSLALCYGRGEGVLEDYVEAYAWCSISAMNGFGLADKEKGTLKGKMSHVQIADGQRRAKEILAEIERKKQVAELGENEVPAADIAPAGFGSGLLVDGGYVLTCWHVVDGGDKISISCNGKDYAASVVQKDPANDIAVLRVVNAPDGASLSLADSKLGANVFTMGFPHPDLQGVDVKFTTGSISGLTGPQNTSLYYQISVPLQSGNSGGPLFDEKGNLVGMVAAKLDSLVTLAATGDLPQNVNYAIKADYLRPLLKTVDGIFIQPAQTKEADLLSLIDDLKKSVVMIKVY